MLGTSEDEVCRTLADAIVDYLTRGGTKGMCQALAKASLAKDAKPFVVRAEQHPALQKKFANEERFKQFLALQPRQQEFVHDVLVGNPVAPEDFDHLLFKIAAKASGGALRVLEWIPLKVKTAATVITVTQPGEPALVSKPPPRSFG